MELNKNVYIKIRMTGLEEFFSDNGINPNNISTTVRKMMNIDEMDDQTVGGYLRTLYVQNGGSTTLPSEYFGRSSGSYVSNVSYKNISDATPTITRPAINETFKGGKGCGQKKKYNFVSVPDLKKMSKFANRKDKDFVNDMLTSIYSNAIKNKKITVKSLKEAFMQK
jgi:hypothetical protein